MAFRQFASGQSKLVRAEENFPLGTMRSVEVRMSDKTKESLDVLEDWLKTDKPINPKDADRKSVV